MGVLVGGMVAVWVGVGVGDGAGAKVEQAALNPSIIIDGTHVCILMLNIQPCLIIYPQLIQRLPPPSSSARPAMMIMTGQTYSPPG